MHTLGLRGLRRTAAVVVESTPEERRGDAADGDAHLSIGMQTP